MRTISRILPGRDPDQIADPAFIDFDQIVTWPEALTIAEEQTGLQVSPSDRPSQMCWEQINAVAQALYLKFHIGILGHNYGWVNRPIYGRLKRAPDQLDKVIPGTINSF